MYTHRGYEGHLNQLTAFGHVQPRLLKVRGRRETSYVHRTDQLNSEATVCLYHRQRCNNHRCVLKIPQESQCQAFQSFVIITFSVQHFDWCACTGHHICLRKLISTKWRLLLIRDTARAWLASYPSRCIRCLASWTLCLHQSPQWNSSDQQHKCWLQYLQ